MKKSAIILSILVFYLSTFAQENPLRVEIQLENYMDQIYAIPAGGEGVIIFHEGDSKKSDDRTWYFAKYNTDFEKVWVKEFHIERGMYYHSYQLDQDNTRLYLLFMNASGGMKKNKDCSIIDFNYKSATIKQFTAKTPMSIYLEDFLVNNGVAYMGGKAINSFSESCAELCFGSWLYFITGKALFPAKAELAIFKLEDEKISMQPYSLNGTSAVLAIDKYKDELTNVLIGQIHKKAETFIEQYDENGELVNTIDLKTLDEDKQLLTAQLWINPLLIGQN